MPLYEYRCNQCDDEFEFFLPISEYDKKIYCPNCNNILQKLISACSFINKTSEHRDIDCIIGEDAEKKWKNIYKKQAAKKKKLKESSKGGK